MQNESKQVAVKIVNRFRAREDFLKRFLPRELELWPTLDHLNIIKCIETFEELHLIYIVLEYASNGNMLKYLVKFGPLPEDRRKVLMKQVNKDTTIIHLI